MSRVERDPERGRAAAAKLKAHCLYVLTLEERRIEEVTAFVTPETFQRFALPESIAVRGPEGTLWSFGTYGGQEGSP